MKDQYPVCKTVDTVEDWFGTSLPDPYSWLRDAARPEVLDFVARENAYTDQYFDGQELEEKIKELKAQKLPELFSELIPWKEGYLGVLHQEGAYLIKELDKELKVTGDLPQLPALEGLPRFGVQPCPKNQEILALMIQHPGAARPSVAICDMEKLELMWEIHGVFSYCWSRADGCLYYSSTRPDPDTRESQSVFYRFDPRAKKETILYTDEGYSVFGQVEASGDGAYVLASVCRDYSVADWVVIDTAAGKTELLTDHPVEWKYIDTKQGAHYFVTVSEAANGAVIRVRDRKEIQVVLPESSYILDKGFSCGERLFVLGFQDVSSCLISVDTKERVALPEQYGALSLAGQAEDRVFLKFESFLTPPELLSFDGRELTPVLVSSDKAWEDLVVEQKFAPSTGDGVRIPYYMVRRRDARPEGTAPVLMYAYGGYNCSMPPWYTEMVTGIQIPDWVEKGGIYVHCNLRGGNEYGPRWHEDGMGRKKRHCYEDFIGIAEELIRDGWAGKGKIGIAGCSNGGLLMSALVTMRPDLWGCVIDSVPHTDMIHFTQDDRGPMYITEYGDPRESREMFEYLLSYSPYHNIKKTAYPPVYIQTGELDNNVPPYHGKKFAARLQAENQSDHPILLRVLAEGSHDRGKGEVFWKTIAEMQLFLEKHLKGE